MDVVQMSLSGTVLIIAVVIVRALTLHKLPKKTFLVLWGVVICRLLIPFSIPSPFSFYTGLDMIKQVFKETTTTPLAITSAIPYVGAVPDAGHPIGTDTTIALASPVAVIWLAGMCACALFFIVAYIKCRREFSTSLPVENDFIARWLRDHPQRRPVQIRQCDRIKAPLTYGIFQPVVLLPQKMDWTDETRLRYILTHEFVHIQHFDTLIKLVLISSLCIHWFNPFVWLMCVLANRDIELSCDETVVQTFGETIKSAYAMMLVSMEEKKNALTPLVNNFSKNAIEERVVSIMKMKKTSLVGIILAMTLVVGVLAVFATTATPDGISRENIQKASDATYASKVKIGIDEGIKWMNVEEFKKATTLDVVWWTYDEYKTWLEQEKLNLQNAIGKKTWNSTDGWFVWTQEKVDKKIRIYEQDLRDIKNGMMISKTVDGSNEVMIKVDRKK